MVLREPNNDVPDSSLAVPDPVGLAPIILWYVVLILIAKSKAESTVTRI